MDSLGQRNAEAKLIDKNGDHANYLPSSTLRLLEPRPGGHWSIVNETQNTVTVSYNMDNGLESVTYNIQLCKSETDIEAHCSDFLYELPPCKRLPSY